MEPPLVSAVIPAYNAERFLEDAIRSVLEQTYEPIECVVVDDGSTDGTRKIAGALGGRVRCVSRSRGGVSAARNAGAAATSGDYLAFLDADDAWLPEKISLQMEVVSNRPEVVLVYTGLIVADEGLVRQLVIDPPQPHEAIENTILLRPAVMSISQTSLIARSAFDAVGGFDERLSTSADADLGCRLALTGPISVVDRPLVLYRRHAGQMHLDAGAMQRDMTIVLDKLFTDPRLPPGLKRLRRRAYSELRATLAAAALRRRDIGAAAGHGLRSVLLDPRALGGVLAKKVWRKGLSP